MFSPMTYQNAGGAVLGTPAPKSAAPGALWWDTVGGQLYVRTCEGWVAASCCECGVVVGPDRPANPAAGRLWWNTRDGQLYVWSGSQWVAASCCEGASA